MENKYYTPNLEEFSFNFEYEYRTTTDDEYGSHPTVTEWTARTITSDSFVPNDERITDIYDIEYGYVEVKVKYLDRSDIEELGFVLQSEGMLEKEVNSVTIKNKSELKKLLKQLGL